MVKLLACQMEKHLFHKKQGFTLIEMMLVLFISSSLSVIGLRFVSPLKFDQFENDVISHQLKAIAHHTTYVVPHDLSSNVASLSFNEWGNINSAQSIDNGNSQFIFQLGTGRYDKK